MKIGIDLDEVIVEFIKGFLDFHNKKFSTDYKYEQWHSYNFWEVFGGTREEDIREVDEFFNSEKFEKLKLVKGAKSINKLAKDNKLIIITTRRIDYKDKTEKFLQKHFKGIPLELVFSGDFHNQGKTKADFCNELGISLIIEDNKEYALDCAKKGIKVFLLDKPWNQNCENHENLVKVQNWNEILEKIKGLRGRS